MVFYNRVDMYKWILMTMDNLSVKVLEMVPICKKLENIPIQVSDEVRIETNDFLNLLGSDPQGLKFIMH